MRNCVFTGNKLKYLALSVFTKLVAQVFLQANGLKLLTYKALKDSWVFKGGTCLKKCYFDTYRFSEDLDFTIKDAAHLKGNFLENTFSEISEWLYEQSGIELPIE